MKLILIKLTAIFIPLLLLSSCKVSTGAPNCSDDSVKKLVIDISSSEMKDQLLSNALVTQYGTTPQFEGYPTYEQWNQKKDEDEYIKKIVDYVDKQMSDLEMKLTGVRTNGKNDEIKKCQCGGDLTFSNGNKHNIEYTAQYTEDGQVYVEVFGL